VTKSRARLNHSDQPFARYFLEHVDLTAMDTSFWSITGKEIGEIDPQQRLALEVVYECLQNSGTTKWHGRNIGTYFGTFGEVGYRNTDLF
jgi:acyl transferase domain-containing protein